MQNPRKNTPGEKVGQVTLHNPSESSRFILKESRTRATCRWLWILLQKLIDGLRGRRINTMLMIGRL